MSDYNRQLEADAGYGYDVPPQDDPCGPEMPLGKHGVGGWVPRGIALADNYEEIGQCRPKTSNMELWRAVEKTRPDMTRRVQHRGGFTAIDAHSQLQRATEIWGPYGGSWGLRELDWQIVGEPASLILQAYFVCPVAQFPIAVDMPYRVGQDCYKKLLTECRSKSLSLLGFNADVFLGKYDQMDYVRDMEVAFAESDQLRKKILGEVAKATTVAKLNAIDKRAIDLASEGNLPEGILDEIVGAIVDRRAEIE